MAEAYVKIEREVEEKNSYTVYQAMRNTLHADKVEMQTVEAPTDKDGKRTAPQKNKVIGYFWSQVVLAMEEASDEQRNS